MSAFESEFEPINPTEEALIEALTIRPFDTAQAPYTGLSYGPTDDGIRFNRPIRKGKDTLLRVNQNEEHGLFGNKRPQGALLLQKMALFGKNNGLSLPRVAEIDRLRRNAEELGYSIGLLPDMEAEVVSLRSLATQLAKRREDAQYAYVEGVNTYIGSVEEEYPYYVVVDKVDVPESEQQTPGFIKINKVAQLAGIDFADDGVLHSLLRQADGKIGYVEGRVQLYR